MYAVLTRGAHRQTITRSLRYLSTQTPLPPSSSKPQNAESSSPKSPAEQNPPSPVPSTSSSLSLDFSPDVDQERTGAKSSKDSLSSIERKRRYFGRVAFGMFVIGVGVQAAFLGRDWEEAELKAKKMKIEDAPSTRLARTKARFLDLFDLFSKPQWSELLPPPLPAPHQKPYTLLLSVDDLLVTSTWDRQHGWRTAKRPGVDYFLAYLSQFYEVVIFTSQYHYTALPIIERLDPYNFFINYKLFREATRSVDGKVVKDLSYLNRDLSKVVLLDTHEEHIATHPENSIIIPKWTGDPRDKGLVAMIPFLESIGIYKPADVRPILDAYRGKDIPLEYAQKEAEAKVKHVAEWQQSSKGLVTGGFTLSGLFGGSGSEPSQSPVPPTYLEQKRKEAQLQYREEQAYIAANKGQFERLLEEDRQAMAKEMSGTMWGMLDTFAGGAPKKQTGEATAVQSSSPTAESKA